MTYYQSSIEELDHGSCELGVANFTFCCKPTPETFEAAAVTANRPALPVGILRTIEDLVRGRP